MIAPCMVNNWLYCSGERNCIPGLASSARMISAIAPPMTKKTNEATRYIIPTCFASVVRKSRVSAEPGRGRCTGHGRVSIGCGSDPTTLVMVLLRGAKSDITELCPYNTAVYGYRVYRPDAASRSGCALLLTVGRA